MPTDTEHPRQVRRPERAYQLLLAFVGGFHIMLLEMCAFRVLQTTFGSSVFTSGVLLTLVMTALAAGYWLGGQLSERCSSIRPLLLTLLVVVLHVQLVDVLLAEAVLDWLFGMRSELILQSTSAALRVGLPVGLATLLLYALPMVLLAQITPFLIARATEAPAARAGGAGSIAGRLMAVATAGGIAGTIVATFLLIPRLGIRGSLAVLTVSLLLVVVLGWVVPYGGTTRAQAAALALVVASSATFWIDRPRAAGLILEQQSLYGNIKVYRRRDHAGRSFLVYAPSRRYLHSLSYEDHPLLNHYLLQSINIGIALDARRWLVLGVAGGAVFNTLRAWRPDLELTGVDINPAALSIARRTFRVPASVELVAQDARMFLADTKRRYDVIFVDLAQGEHLPAHCSTREFFALVHRRLSEGGVMTVNTNLDNPPPSPAARPPIPSAWHLHAAIHDAGFRAVFHNDTFFNGNVYAFKREISHLQLQERLKRALERSGLDPNIRASLAATYLKTAPLHRTSFRPFSDDWAPKTLLHRKSSRAAFAASVRASVSAGEPRSDQSRIRRSYLAHAAKNPGFFAVPTSPGRRAFCREVGDLLEDGGGSIAELATYAVDPLCEGTGPPRHRKLLRSYLDGLRLYRSLAIDRALGPLLRAIEALDHRRPRSLR